MLISICIPHYNRANYLLAVLESIRIQDYPNVEVIISDDCSNDDSERIIPKYISELKDRCLVSFQYIRQAKNLGFDGNLRASLEAAKGDYLFILGNDDALPDKQTLSQMASILKELDYPDVAFTNFHIFGNANNVIRRAQKTGLIGSGPQVAVRTFRSFSFVGGILFKQSEFKRFNTNEHDGSVYFQIYLAARIISAGGKLATISESMVEKDIQIQNKASNSYLDVLARDNHRFRSKTGGLDQVGIVACSAILPYVATVKRNCYLKKIYGQLLFYTYPNWLIEYRKKGVFKASINLALGCIPSNLMKCQIVPLNVKMFLLAIYLLSTVAGLFLPLTVLEKMRGFFFRLSKSV